MKHMTSKQNHIKTRESLVGTYSTMGDAEAAVKLLSNGKFPIDHLSILTTNLDSEKDVIGFVTQGDMVKDEAKAGAWFGGLYGLLVGTAFIWVPDIGPLYVAGPLAATLISTLEGAVTGSTLASLLSGLANWSVDKQHISTYADELRAGKFLIIAHGSQQEIAKAEKMLKNTHPKKLNFHTEKQTTKYTHVQGEHLK